MCEDLCLFFVRNTFQLMHYFHICLVRVYCSHVELSKYFRFSCQGLNLGCIENLHVEWGLILQI